MNYDNFSPSVSGFGLKSRAVTPSDSTDLPKVAKAVVTLSAGNLAIIPARDPVDGDIDPVVFTEVPAGFIPPYLVRRVMATGTTCGVRTVED